MRTDNFANKYFCRYNSFNHQIAQDPSEQVRMIVVIPCYNETQLLKSLVSLKSCDPANCCVEVIVVINSSEKSPEKALHQNEITYHEAIAWIEKNQTEKLKFFVIRAENLPKKIAGVGVARKIGMDEAVRRFGLLNRPDGVIICFDADSVCLPNYFVEIENLFTKKIKTTACSIYYEHPLDGAEFQPDIYNAVSFYELYLRYYMQILRTTGFPYSYHTVGSSMAVRAQIYTKQGGMNTRQAGEDFYFLHKVIPLGNFEELNTTCVFPSPRDSDRVPFGTGATVSEFLKNEQSDLVTYNRLAFSDLKVLFSQLDNLYGRSLSEIKTKSEIIIKFLNDNNFDDALLKINQNSSNLLIFKKRFFDWFDAFRILKFLNFSHTVFYPKVSIYDSASVVYTQVARQKSADTVKGLLLQYRNLEKKALKKPD